MGYRPVEWNFGPSDNVVAGEIFAAEEEIARVKVPMYGESTPTI